MLLANSSYKDSPQLLAAYAPEYQVQHYHIHGRHTDSQQTIYSLLLQQNQLNKMGKKTIKGALLGLLTGAMVNYAFSGKDQQFVHTRKILANRLFAKSLKGYAVMGGLAGIVWYGIYDVIFCPHGRQPSIYKHIGAHALGGGLLFASFYHPAAFGYGVISGAISGMIFDNVFRTRFPRDFKVYMSNFDKQKRAKILRDDEQYQMSIRNVLNQKRVFHPL